MHILKLFFIILKQKPKILQKYLILYFILKTNVGCVKSFNENINEIIEFVRIKNYIFGGGK